MASHENRVGWELEDPDDWTQQNDAATRRKTQNRIAQRNRRKGLRAQNGEERRRCLSSSQDSTIMQSQQRSISTRANCVNTLRYISPSSKVPNNSYPSPPSTSTEFSPNQPILGYQKSINSHGTPLTGSSHALGIHCFDPGLTDSLYTNQRVFSDPVREHEYLTPQAMQSHELVNLASPLRCIESSRILSRSTVSPPGDLMDYASNLEQEVTGHPRSEHHIMQELSPLHLAAQRGSVGIVGLLIESGIDVNTRDDDGRSALFVAAAEGNIGVARLLLRNGADINMQDYCRQTPLHVVAEQGHVEVLDLMLSHFPNIDTRDTLGRSPLHIAIMESKEDIARLLLHHGADYTANIRISERQIS